MMANQPAEPPKFLDQIRNAIRLRRMSYRTEQAYVDWAKRFIFFHNKRHPKEMGAPEIEAFIAYLESGHDIRTVQELLGHADVSTTMVYTHVLNAGGLGVKSPLDRL